MAASENKTLTYSDIKRLAREHLTKNADTAAAGSVAFLAWAAFVYFSEALIYRLAGVMNIRSYDPLSIDYYRSSHIALTLLIMRLAVYHILFVGVAYIVRRHFINITEGNTAVENFMTRRSGRTLMPNIKCGLCLTMYKLLVSIPLIPGIYGTVHFYRKGSVGEIAAPELVGFMLSIGFTVVWSSLLIHYFMSLSLVKYIIELNPRADFFDACDLSVRLMDGWHTKLVQFECSLLPYLLACLLLYPLLIVVPFIAECHLLFAKEIMGDHWQDKIPAMAKRWEKQMNKRRE